MSLYVPSVMSIWAVINRDSRRDKGRLKEKDKNREEDGDKDEPSLYESSKSRYSIAAATHLISVATVVGLGRTNPNSTLGFDLARLGARRRRPGARVG